MGRGVAILLICVALCMPIEAASKYLYLTFHGGRSGSVNIHAFDVNTGSEAFTISSDDSTAELRGMTQIGSSVYFAQAHTSDSAIDVVPACSAHGTKIVFEGGSLSHPYGVAAIGTTMLYATNQDNNAISSFNLTQQSEVQNNFPSIDTPRGLASDLRSRLFVASKGSDAVIILDASSGRQVGQIARPDPIGVLVASLSSSTQTLFVSAGKDPSYVEAFNVTQGSRNERLWSATHASQHGAGLALDGTTLYVVDQDSNSVIKLDATSGKYLGVFLSNLDDAPEQITIVNCGGKRKK